MHLLDPSSYQQRYQAYLNSAAWIAIRIKTFLRADNQCELRYPGCTKRAKEVHHTTYLYWNSPSGDIPGYTVIAACSECHRYHHRRKVYDHLQAANDNQIELPLQVSRL